MFDIGFTELLLIGIVILIVVGPEHLPSVVRTTIRYIRKLKSNFEHIKNEVEYELELDEIKSQLNENKGKLKNNIGYNELNDSLDELKQETNKLNDISNDFEYVDHPKTDNDREKIKPTSDKKISLSDSDSKDT